MNLVLQILPVLKFNHVLLWCYQSRYTPKFIEKIDNRFREKETIIDLSRPVVAIPQTNNKIEDHAIIDPLTRKFVNGWLEAFRYWILQLNK